MHRQIALFALCAAIAACATPRHAAPPAQAAPPAAPDALTVVAEIALKGGDCRTASETYARAAAAGPASIARRAAQVAIACENLPAADTAARRWRALAPNDRDAAAIAVVVALKRYQLGAARAAMRDFRRLQSATSAGEPGRAEGAPTELIALLTEQAEAPAVLAVLTDGLDPATATPATLVLVAGVALDAWDPVRAEFLAHAALEHDAQARAAQGVLARAAVMRDDAAAAIAHARIAMANDPQHATFELADVLMALDRPAEARQELERIRRESHEPGEVERRLALLALQRGDLEDARRRFAQLAADSNAGDALTLTLAELDERAGRRDEAIAGYRRLYDSQVAIAARTHAAGLLMERGDRREAELLLDDYMGEHPESEFDLGIAKAQLLARHGDPNAALAQLDAGLERHPQHPRLRYERAVVLEQAGRVPESVSTLEALIAEREGDPTLLNALGYTLADHGVELARAERLIRQALNATPENPAVLDSLGWVRYRAGDARGGAEVLEQAYRIGRDAEIAAHWGETLWASGDQGRARAVWNEALARDPHSEPLKATLARFVPAAAH